MSKNDTKEKFVAPSGELRTPRRLSYLENELGPLLVGNGGEVNQNWTCDDLAAAAAAYDDNSFDLEAELETEVKTEVKVKMEEPDEDVKASMADKAGEETRASVKEDCDEEKGEKKIGAKNKNDQEIIVIE